MRKFTAFAIVLLCIFGLVGCTNEQNESMSYHIINFTIPAGTDEIIFASEQNYFEDGRVTISADYETDDTNTLEVWFRETALESSTEENICTNVLVSPDSTIEIELDGEKWYEIGIHLTNHSASDIPVALTLHDESWKQ